MSSQMSQFRMISIIPDTDIVPPPHNTDERKLSKQISKNIFTAKGYRKLFHNPRKRKVMALECRLIKDQRFIVIS